MGGGASSKYRSTKDPLANYFVTFTNLVKAENDKLKRSYSKSPARAITHDDRLENLRVQVRPLAEKVFRKYDTKGNGVLTAEESNVFFANLVDRSGPFIRMLEELTLMNALGYYQSSGLSSSTGTKRGSFASLGSLGSMPAGADETLESFKNEINRAIEDHNANRAERDMEIFKVIDSSEDGEFERDEVMEALLPGTERNNEILTVLGLDPQTIVERVTGRIASKTMSFCESGDAEDVEDGDRNEETMVSYWSEPQNVSDIYPWMEHTEWDDDLKQEDIDDLDETIAELHPSYRCPADEVANAKMLEEIRARRNKTLKFNSQFSTTIKTENAFPGDDELILLARQKGMKQAEAEQKTLAELRKFVGLNVSFKERIGSGGPIQVPRVVVVGGHKGSGGNIAINGIYQRTPDDYQGRPVYQKYLEKRVANQHSMAGPKRKNWEERSYETRLVLNQSQTAVPLCRPAKQKGNLQAARNTFCLYFLQGKWVIGPKVGSKEVYARCPGTEEAVPAGLFNEWEVWDVGLKTFRSHKGLYATKGGD